MKKTIYFFIVFILFINFAFPCIIEFTPETLKMKKGETATITLHLKYEHRRCEITLDDTEFETKGIKIISMGEWIKVKRGEYKRNIKIKLTSEKGTLKVIRECTKKGISEGILKVYKK